MSGALFDAPTLRTERLVLRGPVATDAAQIAALASDLNVAGMTGNIPHPYGLADAEAFVARAQRTEWDREAAWVIEHHVFGVVGGVGVKAGDRPELGFWIGRRAGRVWMSFRIAGAAACSSRVTARAAS